VQKATERASSGQMMPGQMMPAQMMPGQMMPGQEKERKKERNIVCSRIFFTGL
jgi:hypothetical protein